ncbi:MAG: gamma-butyrobetaine hydroxylase-like domain-containing protein [Ignavibacteriaceae bacterium]
MRSWNLKPQKIRITRSNSLRVEWDNSEITEISALNLRKYCPCAVCMEERSMQSESFIPVFMAEQLLLKDIKVTGNYGILIEWMDGHSTGIYEFDILYRIAKV